MHKAMNVSLKWLKAPVATLLRFVIKVEAQGLVKQERETTIVTLGARAFSSALSCFVYFTPLLYASYRPLAEGRSKKTRQ